MYQSYPDRIDLDKYDEPRIHMETLMRVHLVEFDIHIRILCLLEKARIRTLGDLVRQTRESLLKINQIGTGTVDTLEKFLTYHHLSLKKQ